jgi:hypothetical protein
MGYWALLKGEQPARRKERCVSTYDVLVFLVLGLMYILQILLSVMQPRLDCLPEVRSAGVGLLSTLGC